MNPGDSFRGPDENSREGESSLDELVIHYLDRLTSGEKLNALEILAEHPDLGREIIADLRTYSTLEANVTASLPLGILGDYTLRCQIGRGGMGVVYKAWQKSLDRQVALKVLPAGIAADDRSFHRFMREAKATAKLNHANIVSVHGVGIEQNTPYYAMEYVEGDTLARVLARIREAGPETETPFGKKDSLAYYSNLATAFADVADGLQHAHSRGVIHRDIKPSNLILDAEANRGGKVKSRLRILDFGLARFDGQDSLTATGELMGTPLYMSPEQAMARRIPIDHRTDVYSLGATLYEALTGRPPFEGRDYRDTLSRIMFDEPRGPQRVNPCVPKDLETIVLKCLRKSASLRYGTAEALAQDLRRFVRGDVVEARPPEKWRKLALWAMRNRWRAGVTALAALVLFVCGLALHFHDKYLYQKTGVLGSETALIDHPMSWLKDSLRAVGAKEAAGRLWSFLEEGEQDWNLWAIWLALSLDDLERSPGDVLEQVRSLASRDGDADSRHTGRDDAEWLLEELVNGHVLRIDCGRNEDTDFNGELWSRDRFFQSSPIAGGKRIDLEGTNKPDLYYLKRAFWRDGGYLVPVPPGRYRVRLHFARTRPVTPGVIVFHVFIDGRHVLEDYDIFSTGLGKAHIPEFEVDVRDGLLEIVFKIVKGCAPVAGIEIEPKI